MEKINENSIYLCRGKGCCPILTMENEIIYIEDDHGNEIQINKNQALLIRDAIKELEK